MQKLFVCVPCALAAAALACALALTAAPASAQTFTWGGAGSTTGTVNYNLGTNWSGGTVPTATGQSAAFADTGSAAVSVTAAIAPSAWIFSALAQSYVVTGSAVSFTGAGLTDSAAAGATISIANALGGTGGVTQNGAGTLRLSGVNTYTGGTTFAGGTISIGAANNLGSGTLTFDGGMLVMTTQGITLTQAVKLNTGGATIQNTAARLVTLSGPITDGNGAGSLTITGAGTVSLGGVNTYSGATNVLSGRLQQSSATGFSANSAMTIAAGALVGMGNFNGTVGSLAGAGTLQLGAATLTAGGDNTSTIFSGILSNTGGAGGGGFTKAGTGTMTLSGISNYTGATTVNAGTLSVDGDISASSMTTVNATGTLGGNGTVGNTTINGGALAPGHSVGLLTVNGNLSFTTASRYMVEVASATADRVNVTGTATLGGATVNASFATGSDLTKQTTILSASGGVVGTFGAQVNSNLPGNFTSALSYDANNAYLNLTLNFASVMPLNANQQAVGNALASSFNRTGGIALAFGALDAQGLTQASGETVTGSQQTTFDAMTMFMGIMTDPLSAGRGDAGQGAAAGYADEALNYAKKRDPNDALAAIDRKAPPQAVFAAHWNVWAAGFGGSQTTDGNAATGSNTSTSSIYGTAVGADYWLSPNTIAGISLAGGGTNFSVANGGSGRSDLFQAGAFVRHSFATAYITAAAAYGWQDITTDRSVGGGALQGRFNANSYSGRIEAGNRYVVSPFGGVGLTPYVAVQVTVFELPAYAESALGGVNTFALSYAGKTVTATRSELGLRSDKAFAISDAVLTLRGRAAWAHDTNTDRSAAATFQALPGASFVVNGAAPAHDAALTTASAELVLRNGITLAATFDGEFSDVTRSYAGKGVVRYAW